MNDQQTVQMNALRDKLNALIDNHCSIADKRGSSHFSVCDIAPYYGWDKDYYVHRSTIIDKFRNLGYGVDVQVRHGVIDITITKPIVL